MGFESVVISLTFLLFKEPSSCSPFWLLTIYIPSICIKELAFLQTLSTIVCRLFEKGPSDRFEKIPRCSFGRHFFNRDPEPLFTYSLAIWMPSWRSVHLNHWPIFLLGCLFVCFFFLMLSYMSCLHVLEMNSLWVSSFGNLYFSQSEDGLFLSFRISLAVQTLKVDEVPSVHFILCFITLKGGSSNNWLWFMSKCVCMYFSQEVESNHPSNEIVNQSGIPFSLWG